MEFFKKYYFGLILAPTVVFYVVLAQIGVQIGGAVVGTILSNLALIVGVGCIYWLDHRKFNSENYVTQIELNYNKKDIVVSYVLIVLLWLFGQYVFLWVYEHIGDPIYTKNYADTFSDVSVIVWTLLLTSIVAPIAEELVFRYCLFGRPLFGKYKGLSIVRYIFLHMLSAILFGLVHGTMMHLIIVIPLGFVLGMLMYKTNRIAFPIVGHMLFNNMSIWLSPILLLYRNYLDNIIVSMTMIIVYLILVIGTIGFVLIRKS